MKKLDCGYQTFRGGFILLLQSTYTMRYKIDNPKRGNFSKRCADGILRVEKVTRCPNCGHTKIIKKNGRSECTSCHKERLDL